MVLSPGRRFAEPHDRVQPGPQTRPAKAAASTSGRAGGLAEGAEQAAVQRTGGAADLRHQGRAGLRQDRPAVSASNAGQGGDRRVEPAAQVDAVVAVADGGVEVGQLGGVRRDRGGDGGDPRAGQVGVHVRRPTAGRRCGPGRPTAAAAPRRPGTR